MSGPATRRRAAPGSPLVALGVDVGTTGVKAVAIDLDGRVLGMAQRDYRLLTPAPGLVELDPVTVWKAARQVIASTVAGLPRPPVAVGLSALGEAFLPVDARWRPLGNAIVSFDQRALGEFTAAMEAIGPQRFESATGNRPMAHHAAFKWSWWRRERPQVYARTASFIGLGSWVALCLGAAPAIDPSLAVRTAVYDPVSSAWTGDLLEAMGISSERLPTVLPSQASCGTVSVAAGRRVGLAPLTPVVVGGLDQACAALELGIDGSRAMLTMGTTVVVCVARPRREDIPRVTPAVPHVTSDRWLAVAGTPSGGSVLRWFRDVVVLGGRRRASSRDSYDGIVDRAAERRTSVLFIPHLGGTRVAFDDPAASGAFLGLTHATDEVDLARAVLDGVAYEIAVLLGRLREGGLAITALRANGGGSRSRGWMQLIADATRLPVESMGTSNSAARGAARLAAALVRPRSAMPKPLPAFQVEPRAAWSDYHAGRLRQYVGAFEALRSLREREGGAP